MTITQLFNVANLFVLPFWALIIFLPNWKVTKRVMESYLPFVPLALAYLYLFVNSITPENAQALSNPQLADIARFFANETAAATGWIHFLVMDLLAWSLDLLGRAKNRHLDISLPVTMFICRSFRSAVSYLDLLDCYDIYP